MYRLMPLIPELWEAEVEGLFEPSPEFETSLTLQKVKLAGHDGAYL